MADLQTVARRAQPLWGASLDSALRQLADTLRQQYGKPAEPDGSGGGDGAAAGVGAQAAEQEAEGDGDEEESEGEEEDHDHKKLAVGAEEQAELLAGRRARQLQPACLKLIKDLLQRQAGGGKHD